LLQCDEVRKKSEKSKTVLFDNNGVTDLNNGLADSLQNNIKITDKRKFPSRKTLIHSSNYGVHLKTIP
jgi:hypothetical protein